MICQRVREGISKAKLIPGKYVGSKGRGKLTPEIIRTIKFEYVKTGNVSEIARKFDLSRQTVYKFINMCEDWHE